MSAEDWDFGDRQRKREEGAEMLENLRLRLESPARLGVVTEAALEKARPLIGVWWQTSSRHRHVARFPEGQEPAVFTEALRKIGAPRWALEAWEQHERLSGDYYLRCYASREGNSMQLDPDVWEAYKSLGGGTYR